MGLKRAAPTAASGSLASPDNRLGAARFVPGEGRP